MKETVNKPLSNAKIRSIKEWFPLVFSALALIVVAFMLTFQFVKPAPPKQITIATGNPKGAYYAFAQQYAKLLAKEGITLHIKETAGSVENLKLLSDPSSEVDLAFVQGGISTPSARSAGLVGLASLYYEPLWIFYRQADYPISQLTELSDKRIAIGAIGSGTRLLMQQLLAANGLVRKVQLSDFSGNAAFEMLTQGHIDAVAVISSDRSDLVRRYLSSPEISTMSFTRAEAYQRHFPFLSKILYPRGLFSLAKDLPSRDLKLIAPAATLVAKPELHPALISLLLQAAAKIHTDNSTLAPTRSFPNPHNMAFPISDSAKRQLENGPPFLQRYLPFWAANLVDRLKILLLPLVALMIPLSRMLPPIYRWRMRSRVYSWYDEIQHIDIRARENSVHDSENIRRCCAELDEIEEQVRNIEVPLSFADELYSLRQHIELIRAQLERVSKVSEEDTQPSGAES